MITIVNVCFVDKLNNTKEVLGILQVLAFLLIFAL